MGTYASILNPSYEEYVHTYATTKEMKNNLHLREVVENSQESGIQVTFILVIKL